MKRLFTVVVSRGKEAVRLQTRCLIAFVAIVAAYPTVLAQTQADDAERDLFSCVTSLSTRSELAPLVGKLVLSGEPTATLEMQAVTTKPDEAQREALSKWFTLRTECNQLALVWMNAWNAPTWFRAAALQTKDSTDALISSLYRGEVSFGEFNVKQLALFAELRRRLDEGAALARKEVPTNQQSSRAEAASPPAPIRRNLDEDRYQCEMDAARAYPVAFQQRMTSPGVQVAPNQSLQTNCTGYGAQWNCSTNRSGADASIYNRPPTYITEDVNLSRRQQAFASCMTAKGYRRN